MNRATLEAKYNLLVGDVDLMTQLYNNGVITFKDENIHNIFIEILDNAKKTIEAK